MRDGWKRVRLGDFITDIAAGPFGSNLKVECFVPSGFPIIDGANLKEYKVTDNITKFVTEAKARSLHRSIARRFDVVVTISGTIGQISYIPEDSKYSEYLCSQRQFRASFDSTEVYVPYLIYYFHTREGQSKILMFANQVGVPALAQPLKNFRNIEISLPPLSAQQRIAAVLGALDDKIELNRKMNANLEAQAQALFKSWFIDFEPWGGQMPAGWKECRLDEVSSIVMGQSPSGADLNESGDGVVFYQGRTEFGGRFPDVRLFTTAPKRLASKGDILISVRAPVGDLNIATQECCIGRGVACAKSEHQSYLYYALQTMRPRFDIFNGQGTVFGCINKDALNGMKVTWPAENVMRDFERRVIPMDEMIASNFRESRQLAALRDALLPKLMSGELSVEEVA